MTFDSTNKEKCEKLLQESIDGASIRRWSRGKPLHDVTNKIGFEQFELLEIIEEEDRNTLVSLD